MRNALVVRGPFLVLNSFGLLLAVDLLVPRKAVPSAAVLAAQGIAQACVRSGLLLLLPEVTRAAKTMVALAREAYPFRKFRNC